MYETIPLISQRKPRLVEMLERRYQVWIVVLAIATLAFGVSTWVLHGRLRMAEPEVHDAVYDNAMREYEAVRDDPHLRRYLIAKIKSLALEHQVDPDLLFSVVAVESSFRVVARSEKNARGLGQLMFGTAKAVNPGVFGRPDDLYDVHLNLETALKYLKANLVHNRDDIRMALLVYYYGDSARRPGFQDTDDYVRKVMDSYNRLQQQRRIPDGVVPIVATGSRLSG